MGGSNMNILLVRAKPDFMDMMIGIPAGLAWVASTAERLNHAVEILDLALEKTEQEADRSLQAKMKERKYDLVGITAMTLEYEGAARVARMIKELDPRVPVVFGGHHGTNKPEEVVSQDFCDYVVRGEGEAIFADLLTALSSGGTLDDVKGIAFKRDGQVFQTEDRGLIMDLDSLPWPSYHLLEVERYFDAISARTTSKNKRCIQIFTSRGCPWHCTYCHDLFGKSFRARSAENVLGEIRLLYDRWGVREFMVDDDIFNMDMDRAKRVFDMVKESGMKIHFQFNSGLRLERFDEELVRKMAEGGTHFIAIAFESPVPRIQKMIKKYLKLERAPEVLSWTRKYGIRTLGFFMLGFPTETIEEVAQTIKLACSLDLDEALFSIATPYPGTELNKQVMEMNLYDPDMVSQGGELYQQLRTEALDFKTLKKLQRKAYCMFFLTRLRFLRLLPRMFSVNASRKYLKAIERHLLAYDGTRSSRIN
jgi:anaerobic magnesium-protoporphyrin IX monomethyl ester cyclase